MIPGATERIRDGSMRVWSHANGAHDVAGALDIRDLSDLVRAHRLVDGGELIPRRRQAGFSVVIDDVVHLRPRDADSTSTSFESVTREFGSGNCSTSAAVRKARAFSSRTCR